MARRNSFQPRRRLLLLLTGRDMQAVGWKSTGNRGLG